MCSPLGEAFSPHAFLFLQGYYSDKIIPCISNRPARRQVHLSISLSVRGIHHRISNLPKEWKSGERFDMPAASKYANSRSIARLPAPLRVSLSDTSHRHGYPSTVGIPILLAGPSLYGKIIPSLFPAESSCHARLRTPAVREVAPRRAAESQIQFPPAHRASTCV